MTYILSDMNPNDMFVARSIMFYDDHDLLKWVHANSSLDAFAEDPEVAELFSTNSDKHSEFDLTFERFRSIVERYKLAVPITTTSSEYVAKAMFEQRMREYIKGDCKPWDICKMVGWIEAIFDFPGWLGNTYSLCDWIEPSTQVVDVGYLANSLQEHLDTIA